MRPQFEMRSCLRPVVQAENRLDDAVQFRRHGDRTGAAAVGAAGIVHAMELHAERHAELRRRSFENHGTPRGMFQRHRQTMRRREGAYGGQIRSRGAMQPGEFLAGQKTP